jgi:hypothetical protein
VYADWGKIPFVKGRQAKARASFNVLLAPWPLIVDSSSFVAAASNESHDEENFGYVEYRQAASAASLSVVDWLSQRFRRAKELAQAIDLVVFPEAALNERQWRSVANLCARQGVALIGGVIKKGRQGKGANSVRFRLPLIHDELVQYKHHRWLIDENQIRTYSLGTSLEVRGPAGRPRYWWENIEIPERKIQFIAVDSRLSLCALICEDLARQDPVAEVVRSVGPNLVIALLMDGPQLNGRWASRYASVLADDPGSSVLTLSCLGMVEKSRPPGSARSRTVASWKDAFGEFRQIDLEVNEEAILLNLQFISGEEWTVDGRSDGLVASYPVLCGIHGL